MSDGFSSGAVGDARLVDRAARARRAGLNDDCLAPPLGDRAAGCAFFASLMPKKIVGQIVRETRRALGGDLHPRREVGVLRRIEHRPSSATAR